MEAVEALAIDENPLTERLHKELLSWMESTGNSLKVTAEMMERGYRELPEFLENPSKFQFDFNFLRHLEGFLCRNEHFGILPKEKTKPTTIFKNLWEAWQYCRAEKKMGAMFGPAGSGKSVFARECKRQDADTVIITASILKRSMSKIFPMITKELGCTPYHRFSSDLFVEGIVKSLREWPRPLIIDEAHFLRWDTLEALRTIYDILPFGVLYIGQERLYDEMRGKKNKHLYDQIFSRIAIRRHIGKEVQREDVKLIAQSFCPHISGQCVNFLYDRAKGEGRFRTMVNLLKLAIRIAEGEMNMDILKQANRFLVV